MVQPLVALTPTDPPGPFLDEQDMPESTLHDHILVLLQAILRHWAARTNLDALVARNLACRWLPTDARLGVDPDLMLITPAPPLPPGKASLKQLRLWEAGHAPPRLSVEVVSEFTASKDYLDAPRDHARAGVQELWVFDPELHGPGQTGGPFLLQMWRRQDSGAMARVHAGSGPAWSDELQAWVVLTERATRLRLAEDRGGKHLWLTEAEAAAQALAQAEAQAAEASAQARAQLEAAAAQARAQLEATTAQARAQLEAAEAAQRRQTAEADARQRELAEQAAAAAQQARQQLVEAQARQRELTEQAAQSDAAREAAELAQGEQAARAEQAERRARALEEQLADLQRLLAARQPDGR